MAEFEMIRASCAGCRWKTDRHSHIQAGYSMEEHRIVSKHSDFSIRLVRFVEEERR